MPQELVVSSAEEALAILFDGLGAGEHEDLERIILKPWAASRVKIRGNFHSEMNGPFLEAYAKIDDDILRLFALARYGSSDIRVLKQEDIDEIDFRVKVEEGSSDISDNLWKLAEKLSTELVGKMTGAEIIVTVLGLAVIGGTAWGVTTFLEGRKEARLEEIRSDERREALTAMQFAATEQRQQFDTLANLMLEQNEITKRALQTAVNTNEELLKAASKTDDVEISGVRLLRSEARELRGSSRRRSSTKIIEQYMRIVDVNTSDPTATSVVVEDPDTARQNRITFRDRLIDVEGRAVLLRALDSRGVAWLRLVVREVEDEITSMEILGIAESEPDETNVTQIRPSLGPTSA